MTEQVSREERRGDALEVEERRVVRAVARREIEVCILAVFLFFFLLFFIVEKL